MAQKLILPINNMRINVGYKSPKYLTDPTTSGLGIHYGQDLVVASNATRNDRNYIYASGVGKVIKAGWDNLFGYVVVVVYYGAKYGASYKDLTVRYFHMDSVSVTTNQNVTKDTKLGVIGRTGKYAYGIHLHVEVDTDTQYPLYSPTGGSSGGIIKKGIDSTINPSSVFHCKSTSPDKQSWIVNSSDVTQKWVTSDDLNIKEY